MKRLLLSLLILVLLCVIYAHGETITREDIMATVQHLQVRASEAETARADADRQLAAVSSKLADAQAAHVEAALAVSEAQKQADALQRDDDAQRARADSAETKLVAATKLRWTLIKWLLAAWLIVLTLLAWIFRRPLGLLFGVPIP